MLDPRLHEKMNLAYAKIGEMAYEAALNLRKGKDYTRKQQELYDEGIKLLQILKILFAHVDTATTPPTLYNITELQVNKLVRCLDKIGKLDRLPVVPTALPVCKPIKISNGADGQDGAPGINGTDANIIVEAEAGEAEIVVTPIVISGVKHYQLRLDTYSKAALTVAVQGTKVYEIGVVVASKTINLTTTKGSKNITALTMTDSTLNTQLQGVLNLATVNGVTQPVVNFVTDVNVSATKTYQGTVTDGINPVSTTDSINFYYPILYGSAVSILTTSHYTALSKLIIPKGPTNVLFNAVDNYFYIAVPDSYGTITIKDQNGFDVTSLFTVTTLNVTSVGLTNNWVVSYKVYRTTDITDISSKTYSFTYNG